MNASASSKSSKHWLIGLLVTATMLGGATVLWESSQSEPDKSSPPVKTAPIISKVTALGRLEPETEIIHLFAPIALEGDRVAQLLVKRGDWVKADRVVATLASRDRLQAALEEAQKEVKVAQARLAKVKAGAKTGEIEAQQAHITQLEAELRGQIKAQKATINRWQSEVRTAKAEYNRYESLYQDGAISASQRDNKRLTWETAQAQLEEALATENRTITTLQAQIASAKATLNRIAEVRPVDVKTAQAELDRAIATVKRAETELAQAYVRTPIVGQILKIHSYPGETIDEEQGIAELGQTNKMVVVAEVYQTDISKVRLGQTALITSKVLSEELHGTVSEIDLQVSQQKVFSNQPGENLDRRVVEVKILLTPEDSEKVAGLTNLQVQTAILLGTENQLVEQGITRQAPHLPQFITNV
ncbi:MAG: ABC exporter membrane fusion protein [Xenococcaceae cyanobacterium MO_188.B29]|nr:ABC exporter membrane fusion protein [Xenococcaceae cyanobacterium MO_188.B29]